MTAGVRSQFSIIQRCRAARRAAPALPGFAAASQRISDRQTLWGNGEDDGRGENGRKDGGAPILPLTLEEVRRCPEKCGEEGLVVRQVRSPRDPRPVLAESCLLDEGAENEPAVGDERTLVDGRHREVRLKIEGAVWRGSCGRIFRGA